MSGATVAVLLLPLMVVAQLHDLLPIPGGGRINPACIHEVSNGLLFDPTADVTNKTKCALKCAAEAVGVFGACAATCLTNPDKTKCIETRCDAAQLAFELACTIKCGHDGVRNITGEPVASGCEHSRIEQPEIQIYAADVHQHVPSGKTGFTSFTADWTVPPLPTQTGGQVVYFWPGFKSSQPEMGFPVLQPVLQYGEYGVLSGTSRTAHQRALLGGGGGHWQLQSWFVDGNDVKYPVVRAPAISVQPGDKITSFMQLDGDTWTVSGTDTTTGENSTLKIAKQHAGDCEYDYAMLVNENINVNSRCSLMPASTEIVFTNVLLDGIAANWTTRANCNGNPSCDCANSAAVASDGDVSLGWKNK